MVKEIKSSNEKKFYLILFLIWTLPFGTFLSIPILFARLFPGFKKKRLTTTWFSLNSYFK